MTRLTLLLRRTHEPENHVRMVMPLLARMPVAFIAVAFGLLSPVDDNYIGQLAT